MDLGEAIALEGVRDERYVAGVTRREGVEAEEREEQILVRIGGVGFCGQMGVGKVGGNKVGCEGEVLG